MSTETTERKVYPSQLNSKTISARIPVQDYVNFLNESINLGISLNDFLLRKIYSNNVGAINKKNELTDELLNFINGHEFEIIEIEDKEEYWNGENLHKYNNPIQTDRLARIHYTEKGGGIYFYTLQQIEEFIGHQSKYLKQLRSEKKEASLEDVKIQLSILINNRFSDSKDKREFKTELFGLLDELS
jgi:hypothetical protein